MTFKIKKNKKSLECVPVQKRLGRKVRSICSVISWTGFWKSKRTVVGNVVKCQLSLRLRSVTY